MTSRLATRLRHATALTALLIASFVPAANGAETVFTEIVIAPQSLATALQAFSEQSGLQVGFESELAKGLKTQGTKGAKTAAEALGALLSGTGLEFRFVNDQTVVIREKAARQSAAATGQDLRIARNGWQSGTAQDAQSNADEAAQSSQTEPGAQAGRIQEIIVTATKRAQSVQDVPISIQAVSAEEISRRGLVSAQDYLRGIPGVNQVSTSQGETIVIRGIETSPSYQNFFGAATVATYFGETPTTSSQGAAGFANIDLKLMDIERVEVLRGPQGTAFGNSALGGAVRTIPVMPKLDRFEGKVSANYSLTSGSGGSNYNAQAIGNIPLVPDRFAIRAIAFRYEDSGYYRNVAGSNPAFQTLAASWGAQGAAVNQEEVGAARYTGGRIAGVFQATDDLRFSLSYMKQKGEVDGYGIANTDTYDQVLMQVAPEHVLRGQKGGLFDTDIGIANLTMEYDLGWADALATYSDIKSDAMTVNAAGGLAANFLPVSSRWPGHHRGNIGEVRLVTKLEGAWNFLGGIYAEDLDDQADFFPSWFGSAARNIFSPGQSGPLGDYRTKRNLKQKAAFAEASWQFVPHFTLTGGVRYYDFDRTELTSSSGNYYGNVAPRTFNADAKDTSYRGNLSYKPNENAMVYAGWSQGFRLGRAQTGLNPITCDPNGDGLVDGTDITISSTRLVRSDNVDNYEIGTKLTLLDRRLTVAADVYRINWDEVPVTVNVTDLGSTVGIQQGCYPLYTANAGVARSEGIEIQMNYYLTEGLRLDVGGSRIRAELTEDIRALNAPAGTRLPASPKVNANLGLQYEFNLRGHDAFVRADSIYVGPFYAALGVPPSGGTPAGDYVKVDLTARVSVKHLSVDLFVRNVTGADDFTWRSLNYSAADEFSGYRIRPRTIGVQLGYTF